MRFGFGFSRNYAQSSAFLKLAQSGANSALRIGMLNNKMFHNSLKTLIHRASAQSEAVKQIAAAVSSTVKFDQSSLSSLNGLNVLLQLIKTVPSISMLAILRFLTPGKVYILLFKKRY